MSKAKIHYYDIGDYLSREEKLKIIADFGSSANIPWRELQPNEHGDWLNQRNLSFKNNLALAPEKKFDKNCKAFFNTYGVGLNTNRDAWVSNFSKSTVYHSVSVLIKNYNEEIRLLSQNPEHSLIEDSKKISWTVNLKKDAMKLKMHEFDASKIVVSSYRPFCDQYLFFDRSFIERPGINSSFYPNDLHPNLSICVSPSQNDSLSILISNKLTNLHFNGDTQCFPFFYYEEIDTKGSLNLFDANEESEYIRKDGISDFILNLALKSYGGNITKEDIFYYVYGFLHCSEYRKAFANDLKKMLPRLPLVEELKDFWAFSNAGRKLADLHLNYESVPPYPKVHISGNDGVSYKVEKMRFPKKDKKDTIIYNREITVSNIPGKAYEYVINGKSAIEWIMERYQVTVHKDSGIKNDPNDWATEHNQPRYILDLLLSIINVSVQTVEIVEGLPKINFD